MLLYGINCCGAGMCCCIVVLAICCVCVLILFVGCECRVLGDVDLCVSCFLLSLLEDCANVDEQQYTGRCDGCPHSLLAYLSFGLLGGCFFDDWLLVVIVGPLSSPKESGFSALSVSFSAINCFIFSSSLIAMSFLGELANIS